MKKAPILGSYDGLIVGYRLEQLLKDKSRLVDQFDAALITGLSLSNLTKRRCDRTLPAFAFQGRKPLYQVGQLLKFMRDR